MEPMTGLEPVTSSLPRKHSTTELHRPYRNYRAGDENRTRDLKLGRLPLYQLSYSRFYTLRLLPPGGERRIRTFEAYATDLQSAPIDRSGISPGTIKKIGENSIPTIQIGQATYEKYLSSTKGLK